MANAEVQKEMPQRMLDAAVAFFQAGVRCSQPAVIAPGKAYSLGAPTIVNFAFAIELYLKLIILVSDSSKARGHDLISLYDQIKPDIKQKIAEHYTDYITDEPHVREMIESVSRNFEDWRYAHEKSFLVTSVDTLLEIAHALHRTLKDTAPNLVSIYEK